MRDRGVSVALSYVLVTSITVVLVGGLIIGATTFVEDQQDTAVEQELTVVGNQLAGNIEQVDRMVSAGADEATIDENFVETASGNQYNVRLVDDGSPRLVVTAPRRGISVSVNIDVKTDIDDGATVSGGTIRVSYDGDDLVIENA